MTYMSDRELTVAAVKQLLEDAETFEEAADKKRREAAAMADSFNETHAMPEHIHIASFSDDEYVDFSQTTPIDAGADSVHFFIDMTRHQSLTLTWHWVEWDRSASSTPPRMRVFFTSASASASASMIDKVYSDVTEDVAKVKEIELLGIEKTIRVRPDVPGYVCVRLFGIGGATWSMLGRKSGERYV